MHALTTETLEKLRLAADQDDDLSEKLEFLIEDLEPVAFGDAFADEIDCAEAAFDVLHAIGRALGAPSSVTAEGDLEIPYSVPVIEDGKETQYDGPPVLIHGDLNVTGALLATKHLLVTGSVRAKHFHSDYESRTTILGDVDVEALTTNGALYVGGAIRAKDLIWTSESGHALEAKSLQTRVYINENHHPDEVGELSAERSFEIAPPADYGVLRELFVDELFVDGQLRYWDVLARLRAGGQVFRAKRA